MTVWLRRFALRDAHEDEITVADARAAQPFATLLSVAALAVANSHAN